jgi:hypothetical protein
MKVGDLVRLLDDTRVHMNNPGIGSESMGLIVEVDKQWAARSAGSAGWRWVKWPENPDWDCMYVEDIEVISEAR